MKQLIISLFFSLGIMCGWAQETSSLDSCIIEGNLTDVPDGTEIILIRNEGSLSSPVDTAIILNGHFRMTTRPLSQIQRLAIGTADQRQFWTTPGSKTVITGKGVNEHTWNIENNSLEQKELNAYDAFKYGIMPELRETDQEMHDFYEYLKTVPKEKFVEFWQKGYGKISHKADSIENVHYNEILKYWQERPYSVVYANTLLNYSYKAKEYEDITKIRNARMLYDRIPTECREFPEVKNIKMVIYPEGVLATGDKMADFELYDYKGAKHHLNEFAGKYLLLEFCHFGCPGCELAKPVLNDLYNKYSDKFEIISISTDSKKTWEENTDSKVIWHCWNDYKRAVDIREKYGSLADPTFFLVSPDGTILYSHVGYTENLTETFAKHFPFIQQ